MQEILNYTEKELTDLLEFRSYKVRQIFNWIYEKFEFNFDNMNNLSKKEREYLKENFILNILHPEKVIISKKEKTEKFLFKTTDNKYIETVLIKSRNRNTICVSSQVGCALNCSFCATAKLGFDRNLSVAEIIYQVLYVSKILRNRGKNLTNIVFMGMGEPLLNYDNVIKTIKMLNSKHTINIGSRHITVSTAGIIEGIKKLISFDLQIRLAVSLNSPFQEIRERIMPISKSNTLNDLFKTLKEYTKVKNKKITFEYIMMHNINMREKDVVRLKKILKGFIYNINVIRYNPMYKDDKLVPSDKEIRKFLFLLKKYNIKYTERLSRGKEIAAGCGQLGLLNKNIKTTDK